MSRGSITMSDTERELLELKEKVHRLEAANDPEFDGTPLAHPAFWRGQDDGVRGAVAVIRKVLDGNETGAGVISDEGLEKLKRDVMELVGRKDDK
jgi:hypothetical protein